MDGVIGILIIFWTNTVTRVAPVCVDAYKNNLKCSGIGLEQKLSSFAQILKLVHKA